MRTAARLLLVLGWSGLASYLNATPSPDAPASLVLTTLENGIDSQSDFVCYGKIHGYIRLPKRESGKHVIESRWIAPDGKVAADSRNTVDFQPARSTAYVWLGFPESNALLGTPDADDEENRLNFKGVWRVEVRWDEQPLLQKTFNVRCP